MSPSRAELEAAREQVISDVIADGLKVLFCGINPGLWSAATGHHFGRPGNRFWPALQGAGFTSRTFDPAEQLLLLELGLGITNVVDRASARADELSASELRVGGAALRLKVDQRRPLWLAVLGVTAYRTAFASPKAAVGPQPDQIGKTRVWVLPNPSGLNAHYSAAALAQEFGRLRAATATPR